MGADLILSHCPFPIFDDGTEPKSFSEIEYQVRWEITNDLQYAIELTRDCTGLFDEDDEVIIQKIVDAAEDVFNICYNDLFARDCQDFQFGDRWYLFAGGTDNGGGLGESFENVSIVSGLFLFEKPFRRES